MTPSINKLSYDHKSMLLKYSILKKNLRNLKNSAFCFNVTGKGDVSFQLGAGFLPVILCLASMFNPHLGRVTEGGQLALESQLVLALNCNWDCRVLVVLEAVLDNIEYTNASYYNSTINHSLCTKQLLTRSKIPHSSLAKKRRMRV